jgi:hypothetical protein
MAGTALSDAGMPVRCVYSLYGNRMKRNSIIGNECKKTFCKRHAQVATGMAMARSVTTGKTDDGIRRGGSKQRK